MEYCNGAEPPLAVMVILPSLVPQEVASFDVTESIEGGTVAVITVEEAVALQPFTSVTITEKEPLVFTVILCVVALLDHR